MNKEDTSENMDVSKTVTEVMDKTSDYAEDTQPLLKDHTDDTREDKETETMSEHKPSLCVRFIFILLLCIVGFGDYFIEDNPAALQSKMLADMDISESSFSVFYSSTSWANTISGALSGYILDRLIGHRVGLTVFLFGIVSAQALFGFGAFIKSYWTMVAGRAFLGLCGPLVAISADVITVRWFKGSGIAAVLAIRISIARLASVIQMTSMDRIYDRFSEVVSGHVCLGLTLMCSAAVCLVPACTAIMAVIMDKQYFKHKKGLTGKKELKKTPISWLNDIRRFGTLFWLTCLASSVYYIGIFPFVALGQIFFKMKYNVDMETADNLNSLVYLMAAITLPIFGILSDKFGKSLFWVSGGILLSTAGHVLLAFTFTNPYVSTVMLGIGYSITTATIWPLAAYVVDEANVGTAYSVMNTGITILQAGMQYFSGYLVDTKGYYVLEVFFVFTMSLSFFCSCVLYLVNNHKNSNLNGLKRVAND